MKAPKGKGWCHWCLCRAGLFLLLSVTVSVTNVVFVLPKVVCYVAKLLLFAAFATAAINTPTPTCMRAYEYEWVCTKSNTN